MADILHHSQSYNLSEAFAVIEDYLIDSMRRNMLRHIGQERKEGIRWSQWQAEMLSGLREYKREHAETFKGIYPAIEQKIGRAGTGDSCRDPPGICP